MPSRHGGLIMHECLDNILQRELCYTEAKTRKNLRCTQERAVLQAMRSNMNPKGGEKECQLTAMKAFASLLQTTSAKHTSLASVAFSQISPSQSCETIPTQHETQDSSNNGRRAWHLQSLDLRFAALLDAFQSVEKFLLLR